MIKNLLLCMTLAVATASSFAQSAAAMTRAAPASGPDGAASAPARHPWARKLKNHKPGAAAVNPVASVDKKGGA
jgi:hypothetical protein